MCLISISLPHGRPGLSSLGPLHTHTHIQSLSSRVPLSMSFWITSQTQFCLTVSNSPHPLSSFFALPFSHPFSLSLSLLSLLLPLSFILPLSSSLPLSLSLPL